jgi:hypothetical protein
MTSDRTKVPPMLMLLQRFHGASYISTLNLSSAFCRCHWKKPQGNGQLFSSRTSCTNLHSYHTVSEILSVLLLSHFNRYWRLTPVNTPFIILITGHENMKEKQTQKKKTSEKLYYFALYCIRLVKIRYTVNRILAVMVALNIQQWRNFSFSINITLNERI